MVQTEEVHAGRRARWKRRPLLIIIGTHLLLGLIFLNPGWIKPDSVGTYAYLRSMVIDRDLSFLNEWHGFGLVRQHFTLFKETSEDGRVANHWWIGTSILSLPFYLVAHVHHVVAGRPLDGVTGAYSVLLAWSSVAFTAAALYLIWALTAAYEARNRIIAITATLIGTPLFFYTYRMPLGTHAAGALLVGLLTWILLRDDGKHTGEFFVGLVFGLTVATRLQHFVLGGAVAVAGWRQQWTVKGWCRFAAGAALGWSPQAIAWWVIYGNPLGPLAKGANLTGSTWSPFRDIALLDVLVSGWHGLFVWSPVVVFAIAGWLSLRKERREADILLLMFAGEWLANGLLDRYFWGGMSFGGRRFLDLAVPYGVGIVWLLQAVRQEWQRRLLLIALTLATLWSTLLLVLTFGNHLELARSTSVSDLVGAMSKLPESFVALRPAIVREPALHLLGMIAAVVLALTAHAFRKHGRLFAAGAGVVLLVTDVGLLLTARRTAEHAQLDAQRLNIDPDRRVMGPLLDQRALLLDLLEHRERGGDSAAAREIRLEISALEREIASSHGRVID